VAFFGNILFPLLNLSTDAFNKGLEASIVALTNAPFSTDSRIPLVLVYLSYGDDQSIPTSGNDPVEYYAQKLLAIEKRQSGPLRVYAANTNVGSGVSPTQATRFALCNARSF